MAAFATMTTNIKASGFGTRIIGPMFFNAGSSRIRPAEFQPRPDAEARCRMAASMLPMRRRRIRSVLDSTVPAAAIWWPCARPLNGNPNQIFGPEKNKAIEIGTKWELFDRRLLVTAALFQTEKENARGSQNVNSATAAARRFRDARHNLPAGRAMCPASPRARPIASAASTSASAARSPTNGAMFGGLSADAVGGDEVTGSVAAAAALPDQCGAETRQRRASIVQLAEQVSSSTACLGAWRRRRCTARRSMAARSWRPTQAPSIPSFWRFDAFVEAKVNKNWTAKLFVASI